MSDVKLGDRVRVLAVHRLDNMPQYKVGDEFTVGYIGRNRSWRGEQLAPEWDWLSDSDEHNKSVIARVEVLSRDVYPETDGESFPPPAAAPAATCPALDDDFAPCECGRHRPTILPGARKPLTFNGPVTVFLRDTPEGEDIADAIMRQAEQYDRALGACKPVFEALCDDPPHTVRDALPTYLDAARTRTVTPATPVPVPPFMSNDSATRKLMPVATGVLKYFPDAQLLKAWVSRVGNDKHNPGEPLHWAKGKSADEPDAEVRHMLDTFRKVPADPGLELLAHLGHLASKAWRADADLQRACDDARAAYERGEDWRK